MHYSPRMMELQGLAVIDAEGSAVNTNTNKARALTIKRLIFSPSVLALCQGLFVFLCFFLCLNHIDSVVYNRPAAPLPKWLQALNCCRSWVFFALRLMCGLITNLPRRFQCLPLTQTFNSFPGKFQIALYFGFVGALKAPGCTVLNSRL